MAVSIITSHVQSCDSNGVPLNAGTIDVYAAGSTTPLTLYPNSDLTGSTNNPITLDSSGRHAMTYIATAAYKLVLKNSAGTTIFTHDNIDPGVAVGSGALPVANGGTGGTTAADARTNLAAASATDMATAQSDISNIQTWTGYTLTTRTRLASGTTAQQPAAGTVGLRYNSTTGYFEADNGTNWKNVLRQGQALPADFATGEAIICTQRSRNTNTANTSITATIPNDTSIPQIGEGTEIFSVSFTPKSASSTLRFRLNVIVANSAGGEAVNIALFKDSTANAIAAKTTYTVASNAFSIIFEHEQSAASTSAATYSVRIGVTAGTMTLNGAASYTLGGLQKSIFIIEEYLSP